MAVVASRSIILISLGCPDGPTYPGACLLLRRHLCYRLGLLGHRGHLGHLCYRLCPCSPLTCRHALAQWVRKRGRVACVSCVVWC